MEFKCSLNEEKLKSIANMMAQRPGYGIEQIHGQRFYRPIDFKSLTKPEKGCEVFVGRLPRDCYEDELVPIFEKFGQIYQIRLMMDFSGTNRGFAYVQYMDPKIASCVAKSLDGIPIRDIHPIGVMVSWEKTRLFVGGIPKFKKEKDVLKEMKRVTDGVKSVIIYMSVYNNKNRGFCFVEYESHRAAMMAKSRMGPGFKLWRNHEVRVDWADPEPQVDDEIMKQVRVLHVRNLHTNVEESDLRNIFSFDNLHVERVKKIRDFAFIHFETRPDAEKAYNLSTGAEFRKNNPTLKMIQVSYSRPQKSRPTRSKSFLSECESFQTDSCLSDLTPNSPAYPGSQFVSNGFLQQLKHYQTLNQNGYQNCLPFAANSYGSPPMVPIKYDLGIGDKNDTNSYVILFPFPYWIPKTPNNNKQAIDNSFLYNYNNTLMF